MVINNLFIPDILFGRFVIAVILNINMLSMFTTALQSWRVRGYCGVFRSHGGTVESCVAVAWLLEHNV